MKMMGNWSGQITFLVDVLGEPTDTFRELRRTPRWTAAFVIIALATAGLSILRIPFLHEAELQELARILPEEALRTWGAFSQRALLLECAVVPLGLAAQWTTLSAALYLSLSLTGAAQLRFASVFSVVVYSHTSLLAGDLVNTLVLYIKGLDAVHSSTDLDCMVGAGRVLTDPSSQPLLFTFLNSVNPFGAWHIVLLAIGLSAVTEIPRCRSFLLTTAIVLLLSAGSGFAISMVSDAFGPR